MEGPTSTCSTPEPHQALACLDEGQPSPFSEQWVTITRQEYIQLRHQANYWAAQHARAINRIGELEQEILLKDAKIKDLQNRLFGKKSEKGTAKSEQGNSTPKSSRNRGQQPGSRGHGRTERPDLPIVDDEIDLAEDEKLVMIAKGVPVAFHGDVPEYTSPLYQEREVRVAEPQNVLLLGWSDILYDVLRELNAHSTVGSKVMVIADLDEKTLAVKLGESLRSGLKNLALDFRLADATEREAYAELDLTSYDSLVVLADETTKDDADTRALRVLLRLSELVRSSSA